MKIGETARLTGIKLLPCWRKQKWKSEGAGEAHMRALLRKDTVYGAKDLNVYKCPHCQWYHVGHLGGGVDGRRS